MLLPNLSVVTVVIKKQKNFKETISTELLYLGDGYVLIVIQGWEN